MGLSGAGGSCGGGAGGGKVTEEGGEGLQEEEAEVEDESFWLCAPERRAQVAMELQSMM